MLDSWRNNKLMEVLNMLRTSIQAASKDYRCDYCNGKIETGQKYEYQFGVSIDGVHGKFRSHINCQKILERLDAWKDEDGIGSEVFHDIIKERYEYLSDEGIIDGDPHIDFEGKLRAIEFYLIQNTSVYSLCENLEEDTKLSFFTYNGRSYWSTHEKEDAQGVVFYNWRPISAALYKQLKIQWNKFGHEQNFTCVKSLMHYVKDD